MAIKSKFNQNPPTNTDHTSTDRKHRVPYIPTQRRTMFPYSPQRYALLHRCRRLLRGMHYSTDEDKVGY